MDKFEMKKAFTYLSELDGIWFPPTVQRHCLESLKTFEIREDDLILVTYPKSGTHWMIEILGLMKCDGHVDKVKRPTNKDLTENLEFALLPDFKRTVSDALSKEPSPRLYWTHLRSHHLPPEVWTKNPKLIYITRNPKDVVTSMFRFMNAFTHDPNDKVGWEECFETFMSKKALFGYWPDHALDYWSRREDDNVFFITYEEMKKDLRSVVRRLESFLGLTITAEGMERILEHASVEGMKKTHAKVEKEHELGKFVAKAVGIVPFIQKGVVGSWKDQLTVAQSEAVDNMLKDRLRGTGLDVHYS